MIKFYKVGGCVRDEILGLKSKDIDYSVEAPSYHAMRQEIISRGGDIFLENPEYFTIRARVQKLGAADFVLCRKDGQYFDGRRPDAVIQGTLHDDLARRDFTMNAIAQDEFGNLIDPFDGQQDIQKGVIRCVGNPSDRFNEDYLRMLRAIRFAVTKNMHIDKEVEAAIYCYAYRIADVSVERVREELHKAFKFNTFRTIVYLEKFNMFSTLHIYFPTLWLKPTLEE